jgi:opacity protein-like surface antigen
MKRLFATALLMLGSVSVAQAQGTAPTDGNENANVSLDFKAAAAPKVTHVHFLSDSDTFFVPPAKPMNTFEAPVVATALAVPLDPAAPAAPSPKPKFLYSSSERPRWELGFGIDWLRFRSTIFNASAVGVKTSLTYFTNEWFGVEGNVTAVFAPEIYAKEHVKLVVYGAGPKIAWRRDRWEPWVHGILGGAHEQPQTAGNSRNTYSIQLGGGADYHFNPRFSGRLEGNYVRTSFFGKNQNNFQLGAGIVMHF